LMEPCVKPMSNFHIGRSFILDLYLIIKSRNNAGEQGKN
jgi:hypothetical protein